MEIKALTKRLPLLVKAKYTFKPLENAVDGLETTFRLKKETEGLAGLPFNDEHVQAVRLHLPALIAIGIPEKRRDILKRLISIGLSDLIVEANKNPYKKKSSNNPGLIKEYKARTNYKEVAVF